MRVIFYYFLQPLATSHLAIITMTSRCKKPTFDVMETVTSPFAPTRVMGSLLSVVFCCLWQHRWSDRAQRTSSLSQAFQTDAEKALQ